MTTYKELDYIKSTGTQYIVSPLVLSGDNYRIECKYDKQSLVSTTMFGYQKTGSNGQQIMVIDFTGTNDNTMGDLFWHGSTDSAGNENRRKQNIFDIGLNEVVIEANNNTLTYNINGRTDSYTVVSAFQPQADTGVWIFGNSREAAAGGHQESTAKFYYFRAYQNNELVCDLIPVLDFNNTPAMYDKVNDVLYYNQGTGQFNYSAKETESSIQMRRKFNMLLASHKKPEYTPVKYIQGDGRTQYVRFDGVFPKSDDAIEVVVEAKEFGTNGYAHVYGAGNATNNANAVNCLILPSGGNGGRFLGKTYSGFSGALDTKYVIYEDAVMQTYNGTKQTDTGEASGQANTNPLTLFRHGATGDNQVANTCGVLRISSLRMWNKTTGKMILDVVPVLDKEGVPCFWDRVNNKLHYNQGTGDFTYEEWDYTPCDYVYADGNAYLNTLWYGDENTATEVYVKSEDLAYRIAIGSRSSAISNNITSFVCDTVGGVVQDFGDYRVTRQTTSAISSGKYVRCYNSKSERWMLEDGGTKVTTTTSFTGTVATPTPIYLGYAGAGTYPASCANFKGNYKEAKIYENGVLVRDLIPAVDGDNVGCFYDKTLNALFYSSGSSDFVGHFVENGVDYKVVKNIIAEQVATSTNTRACPYISTGIYPSTSKKTRLKCKASLAVATTSYEHYLGGTNAGSRFVVGQASGSSGSKFYFGLGTRNYWTTQTVDTDMHIFGLDWATETCSIDDTTWQIPSAGTSESFKPFLINARNTAANANANRPGGGTSYWWKFWEGKKLVYNGIPAVRVSDNKVGLFETVNREFQTTAGTVEYTYTE